MTLRACRFDNPAYNSRIVFQFNCLNAYIQGLAILDTQAKTSFATALTFSCLHSSDHNKLVSTAN